MSIKDQILLLLKERTRLSGGELSRLLRISRQALNRHLQYLLEEKLIRKIGSTKNAAYYISKLPLVKSRNYPLKNISEDKIFFDFITKEIKKRMNKNTFDILYYAFTEMLNNAKDHSKSKECEISLFSSSTHIAFKIEDFGVGIFNHIKKAKNLSSYQEAIEELIKGKFTTDPLHHSGEGIFFTSKSVDYFLLESSKIALEINNIQKDYTIRTSSYSKGTSVYVEISLKTKKSLKQIFDTYSKNYRFSKTQIYIKLFEKLDHFISRSEAKRLLSGLEKFEEIILDFEKVSFIGQGFADEIFRVFHHFHPRIKLTVVNAHKDVQFMIRRTGFSKSPSNKRF